MADITSWLNHVEYSVLDVIGNELSQLSGQAITVALGAANAHNHNSFRWSVVHRQKVGAAAAAVSDKVIAANLEHGPDRRTGLIKRALAESTRPIVLADRVVVAGIEHRTKNAAAIASLWDLANPAGALLAEFKAARLFS